MLDFLGGVGPEGRGNYETIMVWRFLWSPLAPKFILKTLEAPLAGDQTQPEKDTVAS
ncbi:hypothetical protein M8120_22795 [Microcystis aeruginosa str. Chao 1910]|uniref:hypothetical protein n=1 Tax=Microcystis aeruginosa TaxID=1126 RepID=UPI0022479DFA|nr:hypothetical protein [Microcystis aeruginosa]UZO75553.1 hypothetical protein M8120_22795 [Microcystis aeruginosa str. Chao 1910]